jgi:hypothetical protein
MTRYVAFLRAISNVSMEPFRRAMEDLGFADVESFGMSGNLLFNARNGRASSLEDRIAARVRTDAFVRTRLELARMLAGDPFRSAVMFLARPPSAARHRAFRRLAFSGPRPVIRGKTVSFVYPSSLRGTRAPLDFEAVLGVRGTARSFRVVARVLERMSGARSGR